MVDEVLATFRRFDESGEGYIECDGLIAVAKDIKLMWAETLVQRFLEGMAPACKAVRYDAFVQWVFEEKLDNSAEEALEVVAVEGLAPNISTGWQPGALVDRLVDDFADMWAGAVVQAAHPGDVYDIIYVDTGVMEASVDGDELRDRQVPFQLGREFWELIGSFVSDGVQLCAVEQVERTSHKALAPDEQVLWSVLYHCNFGPCGSRCTLKRSCCSDVPEAVRIAAECARIAADPTLSPLRKQRMPWKKRYAERYMDTRLEAMTKEFGLTGCSAPSFLGDVESGKKSSPNHRSHEDRLDGRIRFGRDALRGSVFDPMLGKMVAEDGSSGNRVLVSRGKTWFAH